MGTNFYVTKKPDLLGILEGQEAVELHLGKSSAGWCFSLRVYPEHGIVNLETWYKFMASGRVIIMDEYGREYDLESIVHRITHRKFCDSSLPRSKFIDHSKYHKDGCRRHKVGTTCKHGKGPYDLINHDFS